VTLTGLTATMPGAGVMQSLITDAQDAPQYRLPLCVALYDRVMSFSLTRVTAVGTSIQADMYQQEDRKQVEKQEQPQHTTECMSPR